MPEWKRRPRKESVRKEKSQYSGLIEAGSECFKEGGQRVNAAKSHIKENREVTTIYSNIGHR